MSHLDLNTAGTDGQDRRAYTKKCAPAGEVFRLAAASMERAGLGSPEIIPDGDLHRFDIPDEKRGKKSGWYVCHPDGIPCVVWGCWKLGITEITSGLDAEAEPLATMAVSEQDIAESRRWIEEQKKERDAKRREADERASAWSADMWNRASAPSPEHPYLKAKGLKGDFGARQLNGILLIPLWNAQGQLAGVQRIFPDGTKRFPNGLSKGGLFGYIAEKKPAKEKTVLVCEGWATGASLSASTGCPVFIALDAGNLPKVAPMLKERYPMASIVICADSDRWTQKNGNPWNPGLEYAEKAAKLCGGKVVSPDFRSLDGHPTDFNDLYVREGAQTVKAQVLSDGALRLDDWDVSRFSGRAPKQQWLVDGILPMAAPCLLAAYGGTGKGMLALDLALTVAGGTGKHSGFDLNANQAGSWLGSHVDAQGTAVILSAEDSADDIHRRLEAIDPTGERREKAAGRLKIVPLPNAGGPFPLVQNQQFHQGYEVTPQYLTLLRQLKKIPDLRFLNIDPLASFTGIDVNVDSQGAQFFQGQIARLAEETGACVLVAHHMSKGRDIDNMTSDMAREAVRGSTALVDGVRCTVCVWPVTNKRYGTLKRQLGDAAPSRDACYCAAVVKSNAPADRTVRVLARNKTSGLLEAVNGTGVFYSDQELKKHLAYCIGLQAKAGYPYTVSGATSLYQRRAGLPEPFSMWPRRQFKSWLEDIEADGSVVRCTYGRSQLKYFDVPGGPLAAGDADFELMQGASPVKNPAVGISGGSF